MPCPLAHARITLTWRDLGVRQDSDPVRLEWIGCRRRVGARRSELGEPQPTGRQQSLLDPGEACPADE